MSNVYLLRFAYDRGMPIGSAKTHISARGRLQVGEQRDDRFRRNVRMATFERVDGGEAIPPLRDLQLLHLAKGSIVLTGVEEIVDGNLSRPRLCAQTWHMVPEPFEELIRVEQLLGRLTKRLREVGVDVEILPGGRMKIAGETRVDGEPV